jgi:ATPase subunit of ABC transporter with duplicated ATPase domains
VTHKKDTRLIINDLSLTLNQGDKAVIIGEEGDGKSTLLKIIAEPDSVDYADYTGEISPVGIIGYLKQELNADEKSQTLAGYFAGIDEFSLASPAEWAEVSRAVGLEPDLFFANTTVGQLSGGERVKIQLAKILFAKPDIYLLDEPSNDIDIDTLNWLERFINTAKVPVLYVSHDETLIANTANVIVHMEQVRGKSLARITVARSCYDDYIMARQRAMSYQAQQARREKDEHDAKLRRFHRIQQSVEHAQNTVSRQDPAKGRLLKKKMRSVKSLERRIDRESQDITAAPESENAIFLSFDNANHVPNGKVVLDFLLDELRVGNEVLSTGVELRVTGPEHVCVIGKNGAGKSTLIRKIADMLLCRNDIRAAYMPQNYEELLDYGAVAAEFLAPAGDRAAVTRAMSLLGSARYTRDEMSHTIGELSGGQKGKLFFLKMIIDGANVLVLDEPTRNFSPLSNPILRDMLKNFKGAIISVSHDRRYIAEVATRVYELKPTGLREFKG